MPSHFADRLFAAASQKGAPVCVGIDPVLTRLPESIRTGVNPRSAAACADAIRRYVERLLRAVAPLVPCVKFQSACYERYRGPGVAVLSDMVHLARDLGLLVITDAKRGDIGISAEHYAAAHLADDGFDDQPTHAADALTVSPYLGPDTLEPFLDASVDQGKGLFVLVRTSNPGSDAFQSQRMASGVTLSEHVAAAVRDLGRRAGAMGEQGYSLVGAVVGATKPADLAALRSVMPEQVFLVPGFGTQGGTAEDVRACFDTQGRGALITASRSVIFAYEKRSEARWEDAVSAAAREMATEVMQVVAQ